jgi:hypothetical protein
MDDLFGPYQRTRARVCALLLDTDADERSRPVPACPAWSVHDLAAHLVGIPAALGQGRMPSGDVNGWLQGIVDERRDDDIGALVDEWQTLDGVIEPMLQGGGGLMFADLAVHEHDLRAALDRADHDALEADPLVAFAVQFIAAPATDAGLGALAVEHDGKRWQSHDADVGWTLRVEPWEATRALYSRRTADELRALSSDGDAEPYIALIAAHLPLPEDSLGE